MGMFPRLIRAVNITERKIITVICITAVGFFGVITDKKQSMSGHYWTLL